MLYGSLPLYTDYEGEIAVPYDILYYRFLLLANYLWN